VSYKINWIPKKPDMTEFDCFAKFRYRQPDQKVRVKIEGDGVRVYFAEKQRAVTPGQYVVFYDDTHCLGGGVIEEVF
ncbi:MAG: tRNA 2-thiouridine(34) synthase MnmA, partial [Firmicutes bacterium]|nr:tRNA 2-thiouridine(34) synthase MnmA [Bacillota bacterium]